LAAEQLSVLTRTVLGLTPYIVDTRMLALVKLLRFISDGEIVLLSRTISDACSSVRTARLRCKLRIPPAGGSEGAIFAFGKLI
jgi:hypothetical protein